MTITLNLCNAEYEQENEWTNNDMKEYKLRGYNRIKRFIIDLIIFLLRDAIPILGAVLAMSAVIGTALWLVVDNIILLLFLAVAALFILISVQYLISKIISRQVEKLYGKQELYLINNRLYFTKDVRSRFNRKISCIKILEIYQVKKTKFYLEIDCSCNKSEKYCNVGEDIEHNLEKLRQDEEKLIKVKEILLIKRQYDNQTEKTIEDIFNC
ncbi:hypothetical protein GCWU000282_02294 [Catonella morbi ATCC 51271]|uniref:DUF304 domain-containing protein n=2 Tax=Catonella TaxID=43996 RepID=V2Z5H2_9FIRM|nr:hypothetical protein GCWU000282_02294 [Catonella morbi ATCC 51271]